MPAESEPTRNRLGECNLELDGNEYQARFNGTGWITTGHIDGSFISSESPDRKSRRDDMGQVLSVENMFPAEWEYEKIEYEIIIKAKKLE